MILSTYIYSQTISDISPTDANYKAIKTAINTGYLSVFNNNEFKPNIALTRRDAAVILSKLNTTPLSTTNLTNQKITQLNQFANSYKTLYADNQNTLITLSNKNAALLSEQKILHHEYTKLNQKVTELSTQTDQLKKERKLLYILISCSTILGFVFP